MNQPKPATLLPLTDRDRNLYGYIAIRGMISERDMPTDSAKRLLAHGLIRWDRLGGYYERA